jgi:hypothetical protein
MRETLASESPMMAASALFDTPRRLADRRTALVTTAPSETGAGRAAESGILLNISSETF